MMLGYNFSSNNEVTTFYINIFNFELSSQHEANVRSLESLAASLSSKDKEPKNIVLLPSASPFRNQDASQFDVCENFAFSFKYYLLI